MTPEQDERLVAAFESIGGSLKRFADHICPVPLERTAEQREATVTHIKTAEERLREEQGASDDDIGAWLDIGSRERRYKES